MCNGDNLSASPSVAAHTGNPVISAQTTWHINPKLCQRVPLQWQTKLKAHGQIQAEEELFLLRALYIFTVYISYSTFLVFMAGIGRYLKPYLVSAAPAMGRRALV